MTQTDSSTTRALHAPAPSPARPALYFFFFKIKAFTQPSDGKCHASFPTVILISLDLLETWDDYSFGMPRDGDVIVTKCHRGCAWVTNHFSFQVSFKGTSKGPNLF